MPGSPIKRHRMKNDDQSYDEWKRDLDNHNGTRLSTREQLEQNDRAWARVLMFGLAITVFYCWLYH